jgi:hypothetical protein
MLFIGIKGEVLTRFPPPPRKQEAMLAKRSYRVPRIVERDTRQTVASRVRFDSDPRLQVILNQHITLILSTWKSSFSLQKARDGNRPSPRLIDSVEISQRVQTIVLAVFRAQAPVVLRLFAVKAEKGVPYLDPIDDERVGFEPQHGRGRLGASSPDG